MMHPGNDTVSGGFIYLWKNPQAPRPPLTYYHGITLPQTHKGLIVDKRNRPITGAYVYAYCDTSLIQYMETDTTGKFVLTEQIHAGAPRIPTALTITRKGYKPIIKMDISQWKTAKKNITLRRKWWQSKK